MKIQISSVLLLTLNYKVLLNYDSTGEVVMKSQLSLGKIAGWTVAMAVLGLGELFDKIELMIMDL